MNLYVGTTARWRLAAVVLVVVFIAVHLAYIAAPFVNLESWTGAAARKAYEGDWRGAIETYQRAVSSPPFTYWSIVPFYALFGPGEGSTRAPSLLFGVLTIVAIYLFARRRFDERTACFAAVLLATSPPLWAYTGMICCNDVAFGLTTALLMIALVEADRLRTAAAHAVAGAALGLNLLTKFVAGIYPVIVAILLAREAAVSPGPGRIRRLVASALAYAPGVGVAALFYGWLLYARGSLVSTGIATTRMDMMGTFFVMAPARLAFYVCWLGLLSGLLTVVALLYLLSFVTRARVVAGLAVMALVNAVALAAMQAAVAYNEMALGEMRFGAGEQVLGAGGLLVVKVVALTAGELVLLALWLWGRERFWPNGTIAYWTVSILVLLSGWRGAQRYILYLLPGLVVFLADLALRPFAPAWKRRVVAVACALAIVAGLAQGAFVTAFFATEGYAAADVARYVNERGLEGLQFDVSNSVLCHCSYLVDPALFATQDATPRYVLKTYGRSEPPSDAIYFREVRLLGLVWKKYGVAPAEGADRTPPGL